jgi:hypothetical protein
MDSISAVASDLIEADAEAPGVVRRAARAVLARLLPDERLLENAPDIVREVALSYRRDWRAAKATGALESDCERAAVDVAIQRYEELDPTAPVNRYDAVAATLEMVGKVILADHIWFWHGPDA